LKGLVDSHCHLGHLELPLDEALAGVELVVDIGMGLEESREAAGRAASDPRIYASVGIHPNDVSEFETDPDATMAALSALAVLPRVVAVGETGLDNYRDRSSPEVQEASFRSHIALAKNVDKTLVIHCRDAHREVLDVLDAEGAPPRVVMHCFSGDVAYARECSSRGYFCSFAGNLTYKRNEDLREASRVVPDELLLVETDAPYLAPEPFRGRSNVPRLVEHTTRALADARSMSYSAVLHMLQENTFRAFVI
jgi:TatD DNase family protein